MSKALELAGKRFGRLVVVDRVASDSGTALWRCLCDCGKSTVLRSAVLTSGRSSSCGCWRAESARLRAKEANYARRYYLYHPEVLVSSAEKREGARRRRLAGIQELSDWYIRHLLTQQMQGRAEDIPRSLVDLKREQLILRRLAKEMKQAIKKGKS